jgi:Domain of unknown function (DUF1848).
MATTWNKIKIKLENNNFVDAQAPEIISISRSTDIPAFYADWFFDRLKKGYSAWVNPFNGVKSYISYQNTRFIIFWSKNPRPLLPYLDYLKTRGIECYIQYSLNNYEEEQLEKGVHSLSERIETFKLLVAKLGKGHVIWRFDPLLLTDTIDINKLIDKIEAIGNQLNGYTEKLVFSYADITLYKKVKANLNKNNIAYTEWTESQMIEFADRLSEINKLNKWNYELSTCAEKIDLSQFGITHNHCIDDALIIRFAWQDRKLMEFLKVQIHPLPSKSLFGEVEPLPLDAILLPNNQYATHGNNKDNGQREFCGCIRSKDIGEYNTCVHLCEYCYANTSKEIALNNYRQHKTNPYSETITGK